MAAYKWNSATSGNWNVLTNWTPNTGYPGFASDGSTATIDATGAIYTVNYATTVANTINSLTINSATATLEFTSNAALTVSGTTTLQAGTITLDSGSRLTTNNGLTTASGSDINISSGASLIYSSAIVNGLIEITGSNTVGSSSANTTINGTGTIEAIGGITTIRAANFLGSGTLEADGATLNVIGQLSQSTLQLDISNSASSLLTVSATNLYYGTSAFINFLGNQGEFYDTDTNIPGNVNFNISGLNAGNSTTTPTNLIDLGIGVTVSSGGSSSSSGNSNTSGTITLSNNDVLKVTGITNGSSGWRAVTEADGQGGTKIFLTVCFVAGTRILTPLGERAVENLLPGETVMTVLGDKHVARPIKWLGHRWINIAAHPHPETVAPICIQRGAFAENVPHRDLLVSPDHAIFVDGKLICARQLVNGTTIRQDTALQVVDYFHVELDHHAILLAEGQPTESYLDTGNRSFFANSRDPVVLHPHLTDEGDNPARQAASCAPFVWDENNVRPVWEALAERAASLGQPAPMPDSTTDPELHIVIRGQTVQPISIVNGSHCFIVPQDVTEVQITSRAASPTDARPWMEDRRRLSVYVERIILRSGHDVREVPIDDPDLAQGWWAVERSGVALRRWTNGNAVLPLPTMDGPMILEIQATNSGMAYPVACDVQHLAA